ncbi:MAG: hypothetical protein E3J43_08760 [Candidatus Heimdallarchaeota archaeon]|nr:MAG: hypothetical protein E3J43_08760 [Candidatus Heimdallarchaeota archaeon]
MKTLSAFNQTAIDNPHVDIIRFVKIDFDGLILYLCDRTWGDSGSKCIFNGQIYEPLIISWGNIDQGRINPITFKYSPGQASFTIDNKPSIGGFDCFTSIFNTYKPHKATITISEIFNGATLAEDEIIEFEGKLEDFPSMGQEVVGVTCVGYDLSVLASFEHTTVSFSNYPGADPDEVGKMLPSVYGAAKKVPFIAVNVGSMTTTTEDLDTDETVIDVTDASLFPNTGTIQIDNEKIDYTGKTPTQFTGCTRGVDDTTAIEHDTAATVAEIQSNYYFILDHPIVSVPNVYVEHRSSGEFVRQDSSLYTIYTGQTGDEHSDYLGKGVIEFNLLPFITKQINIEAVDTIDVDDTIDVNDGIGVDDNIGFSVGGSSKTCFPNSGPINGRDGNSYTSTVVSPSGGVVSFGFPSTNLGTVISQTIYVLFQSVFAAPLYVVFDDQLLGIVHVLNRSWSRFTYAGGTWSEPITLWCNLGDTGWNYIFDCYKVVEYTASVSKTGSAYKTGGASKTGNAEKTGTVILTGNSVADTVIGGLVCADVQGQPADDSGDYGTEGSLIERPDRVLKHILVERCSLSSARIDTTSYDASGSRYSTYFMNQSIVLLEPPVVPNLVHDIMRQSRSLAFWEAGKHHLRFIEMEETTDKELIANRIDVRTIKPSYTNRTYIKNKFTAVFDREWTAASRSGVELFLDAIETQDDDSIDDYELLEAKQIEYPYLGDTDTALICLNVEKTNKKKPKLQIELVGSIFLSQIEMGDVLSFSFDISDKLDSALLKLVTTIINQFRVLGKTRTGKKDTRLFLCFEPSSEAITYEGTFVPIVESDDGYCISTSIFYNDRNENLMGRSVGDETTTSSTSSTASTTSSSSSTASTTTSSTTTSSSSTSSSSTASTTSSTYSTTTTTSSSSTTTTGTFTTTTTINPCDIGYEDTNRCTGMVASASSQSLGNESPDAIDGDVDQYWKSEASGFSQWINIEMLIARTIGKIVIKTNASQYTYHPTSFDLKASTTGHFTGEEVTLLSHTNVSWSSDEIKEWWFENGTAYRHWRLYHNGNAAGEYATICEIELYQCNSYSTTTTSSTTTSSSTVSSSSTASTTTTNTQSSTTSSSNSTASTTSSSSSTSSTASTISSTSSTASTSSTNSTTTSTTEPPEQKSYIYGGTDGTNLQDCDEYNPDTWTNKTNIPSPGRYTLAASTINNKGYIYCGFSAGYLQDCDEYTPDTWDSKTDTPSPGRNGSAASTIEDKGYIYGGTDGFYLDDCDEYTPDTWANKTDMPLPGRRALEASTIDNKGYIYCGYDGSTLQDCDEYTPDTWANKTNVPLPTRFEPAASTINNKGYVYCGYGAGYLQDCDEYTPDTWVSKTDTPSPGRFELAASTLNNKGYIYGGDTGSHIQDCDEYTPDTWVSKTNIPTPGRSELAASTIS